MKCLRRRRRPTILRLRILVRNSRCYYRVNGRHVIRICSYGIYVDLWKRIFFLLNKHYKVIVSILSAYNITYESTPRCDFTNFIRRQLCTFSVLIYVRETRRVGVRARRHGRSPRKPSRWDAKTANYDFTTTRESSIIFLKSFMFPNPVHV